MKKILDSLSGEIKKHRVIYLLLLVILLSGLFWRIYRLDTLLGFQFDQGRDALVVTEMLKTGKPVLIGPPIGVDGPFRGPLYYWMLTPFYAVNGDPVIPAYFLAVLGVTGIIGLYALGSLLFTRGVGLMASFFYALSGMMVLNNRWLANPNPAAILSIIFFTFLYLAWIGSVSFLPVVAFLASISLQFETAGAALFLPLTLFVAFKQRSKLTRSRIFWSLFFFFLPLLPLAVFDLRHNFLVSKSYYHYFINDQTSKDYFAVVWQHLQTILDTFGGVLFSDMIFGKILFVLVVLFVLYTFFLEKKEKAVQLLTISLFLPLIFFLFSKGNRGNLWGYYFLNYFVVYFLLVSFFLSRLLKDNAGKIAVMALFLLVNTNNLTKEFMRDVTENTKQGSAVVIENQKKAISWVYLDSQGKDFNTDFYVPPVIPYPYQYLFDWYSSNYRVKPPLVKNTSLLYTLYEPDPGHPERLTEWFDRQENIGYVTKEVNFGDIIVQKRERLKWE